MSQTDTIQTIRNYLRQKTVVRALFLSGSHGTGHADAYADIDLVLVAEDGPTDDVVTLCREAIGLTGEIVLWWHRSPLPALINAITADWTRVDVVILKPDQLGGQRQDALKVLFDHDGLYDGLAPITTPAPPDPAHLRYQIEEFIRTLGLLPLVVGREEYVNGVLGVYHLRNLLVEFMILQANPKHRGGVLHLKRLLSPGQLDSLRQMPPPLAEKDAILAAHMAYARAFLPLARQLAAAHGAKWPEQFEAATWAHMSKKLGLSHPDT